MCVRAFLKLWEKRDEVKLDNIQALLFQMVRNECLNELKQGGNRHGVIGWINGSGRFGATLLAGFCTRRGRGAYRGRVATTD